MAVEVVLDEGCICPTKSTLEWDTLQAIHWGGIRVRGVNLEGVFATFPAIYTAFLEDVHHLHSFHKCLV